MYRPAAARGVHEGQDLEQDPGQDQDLGQDWWEHHRAVAVVRAALGRVPLQTAAAAAATERQAADHRVVGSPAEEDSWQADSWLAVAGNQAAAAAVVGHPERSMADAADRRKSSRIALPPERPSQAPRRWQ